MPTFRTIQRRIRTYRRTLALSRSTTTTSLSSGLSRVDGVLRHSRLSHIFFTNSVSIYFIGAFPSLVPSSSFATSISTTAAATSAVHPAAFVIYPFTREFTFNAVPFGSDKRIKWTSTGLASFSRGQSSSFYLYRREEWRQVGGEEAASCSSCRESGGKTASSLTR